VNGSGQLREQIKEALQLSGPETQATQAAMDRFLAGYQALQAARVRPVTPNVRELNGRPPEETRAFEYPDLSAEIRPLRQTLFTELQTALGTERYQVFRQNLRNWMPLDDGEHGMNTGMAVIPFAHRVCFHPSPPGVPWLGWGLNKPNGESMSATMEIENIPGHLRPQLQDWINQAQSQPPLK
jgi:hypothetical protein